MPEAKTKKKTETLKADATIAGEEKPKAARRSRFSEMWPEDQPLKLLVEENPKKEGSAARERFEHYFSSSTVGDYLSKGGSYQDIAYDVGRLFVQVG